MPVQKRTTVYVDAGGRTRACLLVSSAGAGSVQTEILALSNADLQQSWEGDLTLNAAPAPVAAVYDRVVDTATLLYQTAAGQLIKVVIPAPHSAIFEADGETVDPAQVTALTAAVLADLVTPAGTALTAYVGGTRSR